MSVNNKWEFLTDLDDQLLQGGVILSEWASFLIRDADIAFVGGAYLASIITGLAAVETHLRGESISSKLRLFELIEESDLEPDLKKELQILRKYRNRWVHVSDPWEDEPLLENPGEQEHELEEMSRRCAVAIRQAIYSNPWV